jgi:hypothetical protein
MQISIHHTITVKLTKYGRQILGLSPYVNYSNCKRIDEYTIRLPLSMFMNIFGTYMTESYPLQLFENGNMIDLWEVKE